MDVPDVYESKAVNRAFRKPFGQGLTDGLRSEHAQPPGNNPKPRPHDGTGTLRPHLVPVSCTLTLRENDGIRKGRERRS